jgi:hypothetical protein
MSVYSMFEQQKKEFHGLCLRDVHVWSAAPADCPFTRAPPHGTSATLHAGCSLDLTPRGASNGEIRRFCRLWINRHTATNVKAFDG